MDANPEHSYNICMLYDPTRTVCDAFNVPEGARVRDLRAAIRASPDYAPGLKNETFRLLKVMISICRVHSCVLPPLYSVASCPWSQKTRVVTVSQWVHEHLQSEEMEPVHRLKKYFEDGPAPEGQDMIDVVLVTESTLGAGGVLLPRMDAFWANKERKERVAEIGNLSSPSESSKDEKGIKRWTDGSRGIHSHRPAKNYGPPTALFHHALARLKHRLEHLDELEPSEGVLETCHSLISSACEVYKDKNAREAALRYLIDKLVGEPGKWQENLQGDTANPDAVWGNIIRLIFELKNEDGLRGNASIQAMMDYGKIIAQPKYQKYVDRSNCPVILLGMMGTRLEISTAIFTDGIYVDKLISQELFLDAWQSETVLRLGRIFKALSLSVAELRDYYDRVSFNPKPELSNTNLLPHPLPATAGIRIPKLNYLSKLSRHGELIKILRKREKLVEDPGRPHALYQAKMVRGEPHGEVDVVVKFTAHYNEEAHRILAENGLAPALHFFAPLVGGMYMIVMDYVNNPPLSAVKDRPDCDAIYNDIEKAIQLLHKEGLVFGDLRHQNIVPKPTGGAMLIDFDWVGKHQNTKYPASWNADKDALAEGVGRRKLMDKRHDIFMLEKLKAWLESVFAE